MTNKISIHHLINTMTLCFGALLLGPVFRKDLETGRTILGIMAIVGSVWAWKNYKSGRWVVFGIFAFSALEQIYQIYDEFANPEDWSFTGITIAASGSFIVLSLVLAILSLHQKTHPFNINISTIYKINTITIPQLMGFLVIGVNLAWFISDLFPSVDFTTKYISYLDILLHAGIIALGIAMVFYWKTFRWFFGTVLILCAIYMIYLGIGYFLDKKNYQDILGVVAPVGFLISLALLFLNDHILNKSKPQTIRLSDDILDDTEL